MLADRSLRELLTAFSSADPTPGGGSASALASAVGALAADDGVRGCPSRAPDRTRTARRWRTAASALVENPSRSDGRDRRRHDRLPIEWSRPTSCPKASADEQSARKAAIQQALRGATDVPLGVMRHSAAALDLATAVAAHGHRAAASDVGVAVALLRGGPARARLNVENQRRQHLRCGVRDRGRG